MITKKLFNHMLQEHGLALTQSELIDIIVICNSWISLYDELPPIDEYVLFRDDSGYVWVDHIDKDMLGYVVEFFSDTWNKHLPGATHWTKIPKFGDNHVKNTPGS